MKIEFSEKKRTDKYTEFYEVFRNGVYIGTVENSGAVYGGQNHYHAALSLPELAFSQHSLIQAFAATKERAIAIAIHDAVHECVNAHKILIESAKKMEIPAIEELPEIAS